MKKTILLLAVIVCTSTMMLSAQDVNKSKKPRMSSTYIKDPCNGGRVNFGITFGQAFDWMYDHTEGYEKNGIVIGLRYGLNLNVNLTKKKSFYFSTGFFIEHRGGKMEFLDNIPFGSFLIVESTLMQRTY